MFCIRCGTLLPDGSRVCLNCGMSMESAYVSTMPYQLTRQIPLPVWEEEVRTITIVPNPAVDEPTVGSAEAAAFSGAMPYIPYGSQQRGEAYRPLKKKFILPIGFPVLFGILALAAVSIFAGMLWLFKPQPTHYEAFAVPEWETYAPLDQQEEILSSELQGEVFAPEMPETEQSSLYWLMQAPYPYIIKDSNSRYLDYYELYAYTEEELYYAYFEIWARAGVDMSFDSELESYFSAKEWYHPVYTFDDPLWEILNDYEMTNMETIGQFLDTEFSGNQNMW